MTFLPQRKKEEDRKSIDDVKMAMSDAVRGYTGQNRAFGGKMRKGEESIRQYHGYAFGGAPRAVRSFVDRGAQSIYELPQASQEN